MIQPDKFVRYQIDHLQSELALAAPHAPANPLAERIYRSAWFRFVTQHLQSFYWTVTRGVRSGYPHNGTLDKAQEVKRDAAVRLPVKLLVPAQFAPLQRPRILFDVTYSAYHGAAGIARVMREYAKSAAETGAGVPVIVWDSLDLAPAYPQQM